MKDLELNYTSNTDKFLSCCQQQIKAYQNKEANTIVQTHISPTSICNLNCEFCSVKNRKTNALNLKTIQQYVEDLIPIGLKSIVITGGGEPLMYSRINSLIEWLYDKDISVGLITNGTASDRLSQDLWKAFAWIRISLNAYNGKNIKIPLENLNSNCTVGLSIIGSGGNMKMLSGYRKSISWLADNLNARYIRIVPDCRYSNKEIETESKTLQEFCVKEQLLDKRYFFQHKRPKTPSSPLCYQAYFRPYLHEDGYVYPCDSVVLNDDKGFFDKKYRICEAKDILKFVYRGKGNTVSMKFDPRADCTGCVFSDTVDMLNNHLGRQAGKQKLKPLSKEFIHERFV